MALGFGNPLSPDESPPALSGAAGRVPRPLRPWLATPIGRRRDPPGWRVLPHDGSWQAPRADKLRGTAPSDVCRMGGSEPELKLLRGVSLAWLICARKWGGICRAKLDTRSKRLRATPE